MVLFRLVNRLAGFIPSADIILKCWRKRTSVDPFSTDVSLELKSLLNEIVQANSRVLIENISNTNLDTITPSLDEIFRRGLVSWAYLCILSRNSQRTAG